MRLFYIGIGFFVLLIMQASPTWAVQIHAGAEGLVSHQIGHIFFLSGMSYLLCRLYQRQMKGLDWLEFKIFLWLIIFWNILTFSGHWMHESMPPEKFMKADGAIQSFSVTSLVDAYFYLTRLDHLLLVPSFLFLLLALRKWRVQG